MDGASRAAQAAPNRAVRRSPRRDEDQGDRRLLCPSADCAEGAILLGVVASDGRVAYLTPELRIDQDFVETASAGRRPDARFRFAAPCAQGLCGHWTGNRCGLVEEVVSSESAPRGAVLPRCSIRPRCRWFAEQGSEACRRCSLVIRSPGALALSAEPGELETGGAAYVADE